MKSVPFLFLSILAVFALVGVRAEDAELTYLHRLKAKDAGGQEVFSVKIYEAKLKLEFPSGSEVVTLEAPRLAAGDKRKFSASGQTRAEIKGSEDGFKLRTHDGKLLWKVKIAAEKIKISDNEEGTNPYELKIDRAAGRVKVSGGAREIAEVKLYAEKGEQKVKSEDGNGTLFEAKEATLSPALGVLALASIPLEQRMMLAAELVARDFETGRATAK